MRSAIEIGTPRLTLVGAHGVLLRAELEGHTSLATAIGATVPHAWPPEHHEPSVIQWALEKAQSLASEAIWHLYYIVLRDSPLAVIGTCGFKGRPDATGCVEVGYSVLSEFQRRGYATEAVRALIAAAYAHGASEVAAETLPALIASRRVMEKCGMVFVGEGAEAGAVRYSRRWSSAQR